MNIYEQYMYSYPHKTAYRDLKGIYLEDYLCCLLGQENSLYFHIPFCESKCGYCNLFSVVGQEDKVVERYLDTMKRQAEQLQKSLTDTLPGEKAEFMELVLGGGTPLYLSEKQIERVFSFAKGLGFAGESVVVETSPRQTTLEKLCCLKEQGVTRLSMGVQSMEQSELDTLHRRHSVTEVERAMENIKSVGFSCVNLDIIYGIPEQTEKSLRNTLDKVLSYNVDELFVYPLYIKKDTWAYRQNIVQNPNAEKLYRFARQYLQEHGYTAFSMRRFVKDAAAKMEDARSCGFENTLSVGCGGRSYLGNLHFCTPYYVLQSDCRKQLNRYMETLDFSVIPHGYLLSKEEQKRRYSVKNLFFYYGLDMTEYMEQFQTEFPEDFPMVQKWKEQGYVAEEQGRMRLTEEGFILSDYLGPAFISGEVREKMQSFWTKKD